MNSETKQSGLIPALTWLRRYPGQWLRADVTAGLIAAAVVIPKAMAFATIAGLPVQVGLYTAFVPMVVYALLGHRGRSVSARPRRSPFWRRLASEKAVPDGGAVELAIAGATLAIWLAPWKLLASLLRLGFVANFISDPVLAGFKSGIGWVMVVDQAPKLFGVTSRGRVLPGHPGHGSAPAPDVGCDAGAGSRHAALIFGMERFAPRAPAPPIAVAVGIAASALLGLRRTWSGNGRAAARAVFPRLST